MKRISVIILFLCTFLVLGPHFAIAQSSSGEKVLIASLYGQDGRLASGNYPVSITTHPETDTGSLDFRTMETGTLLKITSTDNNGKWIIAEVFNKRMFTPPTAIEISNEAAAELGMQTHMSIGRALVKIEKVTATSDTSRPATQLPVPASQEPSVAPLAQIPPSPPPPVVTPPAAVPVQPAKRMEPIPSEPKPVMPVTPPLVQQQPFVQPPIQQQPPQLPAMPPQQPWQQPAPQQPWQQPTWQQVPQATAPVVTPPAPMPQARYSRAVLIPSITPSPEKNYRLQVGAFSVPRNALEAFDRLKNHGLNPMYERHENTYRVVLPGISGEHVDALTDLLGYAGFKEAIIREER